MIKSEVKVSMVPKVKQGCWQSLQGVQLADPFFASGHGSSFWMFGSFLPFDRDHKIQDNLNTQWSN